MDTGSFSPPTRAQPARSMLAKTAASVGGGASAAPTVPRSRFPVPASLFIGIELLGRAPPHQVRRRPALESFADLAQVADQRLHLGQGRRELGQAVVGEAADRGTVLVDHRVGAAGGG